MLDIGGWEFLVIAFVLIMVVGPKELPAMLRSFTKFMRQIRSMASEFSRGIQDMADDTDIGDLKNTISDVRRGNLSGVADAIDPDGKIKETVGELKDATDGDTLGDDVNEIRDLADGTGKAMAKAATETTPTAGKAKSTTKRKGAAKTASKKS
jgi:sec-independent protein translocase protein TatB